MTQFEQSYNWWLISLAIFLCYFAVMGIAYMGLYRFREHNLARFKLQKANASVRIVRKEVLFSISTLCIYGLSSWMVFALYRSGFTKIYLDFQEYGTAYFILSLILMMAIHDAYFYWTHRLMHHGKLFRTVHRVHHWSHNPTPWASFSFHPLEAVISQGHIFIIIFLIPSHPLAIFGLLVIMFAVNLLGHSGFEFFPKKFLLGKVGRWINASTFHNLHHQRSQHNFGLYFTFWDRIMGTFEPKKKT